MRFAEALGYSQIELVQITEAYRLADKANAFGVNLGIMRRLGTNLYLNVIELSLSNMSKDIFWFNSSGNTGILDVKMGLTYNIGKRK